jgi:hypothetical protein
MLVGWSFFDDDFYWCFDAFVGFRLGEDEREELDEE